MPTPTELKAEIEQDPQGLGYATALDAQGVPAWPGGDSSVIADMLNSAEPQGSWPGVTIDDDDVDPADVLAAIDPLEYDALGQAKRDYLAMLLGADRVDVSSPQVKAGLAALFPPGGTRTRLIALARRQGSRAEELWDPGTVITGHDIKIARNEG